MSSIVKNLSLGKTIVGSVFLLMLSTVINASIALYLLLSVTVDSEQLFTASSLYFFLFASIVISVISVRLILQAVKHNTERHMNDIGKNNIMADALRASEEKYRGLFEQSEAAVFVFDDEKKCVDANQAAVNLLGYSLDELHLINFNDVDVDPKNVQTAQRDLFSGGEIKNFEHKLRRKDGIITTVLNRSKGYLDSSGNLAGMVSTLIDISQNKELDEQRHRTEKMNALGKITGGIAHDYNNMLGVVLGYANLLERALVDQPLLMKYVDNITHAGERGTQLTKKLLAFSSKKTPEAQLNNPNAVIRDMQHLLEKTLTVRIELVLDLEDKLWSVLADSGDLEDAILNMSINAMYAIDSAGKITIQTHNVPVYGKDALHLNIPENDYVLISIIDTGCGMEQVTQDKIFDPFFSTKGADGTGLGLSQVYGFVKSCGGIIKVYSELGHGSRFMIYFPRFQDVGTKTKIPIENKLAVYRGNETILIVDDELTLLSLTNEMLSEQGYNTFCAENAEQAIELLKHEAVDLIISDIIMPEMDGYQLAAVVQEEYPDTKIQLVSGFSDKRHINMVSDDLQNNMLHKPYSQLTLLKRIKEIFKEN